MHPIWVTETSLGFVYTRSIIFPDLSPLKLVRLYVFNNQGLCSKKDKIYRTKSKFSMQIGMAKNHLMR